jgi:8-oxo-dGTP pyrophosphatase MutT (NUDIX family)
MNYPPVVIVDAQDEVIGAAMLADAWDKGLIHRIVFIIVEDSRGRILLHKRAPAMRLYPDCWDVPGGHVDIIPDYLETARIELREEAGITDAELTEVAHMYLDEPYAGGVPAKRFIKIFHTRADVAGEPADAEEVATMRWFTPQAIAQLPKDKIAEGLRRCLPYIQKNN